MIKSLCGVLALALVSGCSGYLKTEHFELVHDGSLVRFQIHDWYEEETTGPSIGVLRPPVYGFEQAGQLYAIYPVFIRTDTKRIGPSPIPFFPLWESIGEDPLVLKIRHHSKGNDPVEPVRIDVVGPATTTVFLERGKNDGLAGTIYSAKLPISGSSTRFRILLTLSGGSSRTFEFVPRSDWFYSPLFSFNGPNPWPKFERYPQ